MFAKPRSAQVETHDGLSLPAYRGDIVNGIAFDAAAREADPLRMIRAHMQSVGTAASLAAARGSAAPIFTSHEALLLPYEEALTRQVPRQWGWFNLSTHFPWIGMRTAALDGAHVEYFRGIRNPVAVKVGPSVTTDQVLRLCDLLNPDNEPGRLSLIQRMGAAKVEEKLPTLVQALQREGRRVLWVCDPMHGNTESTSNGFKTRRFDNIRRELELSFDIHAALGSRLGGVHLELTGENVTECLGGARELTEADLERAYTSTVDPRLNYEQSLEIAMLIVRKQAALARPASA